MLGTNYSNISNLFPNHGYQTRSKSVIDPIFAEKKQVSPERNQRCNTCMVMFVRLSGHKCTKNTNSSKTGVI